MNVLITGIHGFVGSNIVITLKQDCSIYGVDIIFPESDGVIETFRWDQVPTIPSPDVIIHLAGIAHDTSKTSTDQAYFDINVGLTEKIFDYYLKSKAHKFIYFSSVKAVADTVDEGFLVEDATPAPRTPYGKSKLEAETYLLSTSRPQGKELYILRPAMIHGPGNKGNLNLLYNVLKYNIPYPLGAYTNERSFTSIQNLIFVIERIIYSNLPSGVYNVCDDETLSTIEIARLINQSLGKKEIIWNIPKVFINTLARTGDLCKLPINSERIKKLTETYIVSNAKLKSALKLDSLPVKARDGLMVTLRNMKS